MPSGGGAALGPSRQGGGRPPAEHWLVIDVRAQGVTDPVATGASLKTLLGEYRVSYDKLMLLTEGGLVELK